MFAHNAETLALENVYVTTPHWYGGGVWQAGNGLASDVSDDSIYFTTGNAGGRNHFPSLVDATISAPDSNYTFPSLNMLTPPFLRCGTGGADGPNPTPSEDPANPLGFAWRSDIDSTQPLATQRIDDEDSFVALPTSFGPSRVYTPNLPT